MKWVVVGLCLVVLAAFIVLSVRENHSSRGEYYRAGVAARSSDGHEVYVEFRLWPTFSGSAQEDSSVTKADCCKAAAQHLQTHARAGLAGMNEREIFGSGFNKLTQSLFPDTVRTECCSEQPPLSIRGLTVDIVSVSSPVPLNGLDSLVLEAPADL